MAGKNKRILIADDNEIEREILRTILEPEFDIVEVRNGYGVLEVLMKQKPKVDAVMLDISMPILSGFDVLHVLEQHKVEGVPPVILITAEATKDNVEKAVRFKHMVTSFISKPFNNEVLTEKLHKLFEMPDTNQKARKKSRILTESETEDINAYVSKLGGIFKEYLKSADVDEEPYVRVSEVMEILLSEYEAMNESAAYSAGIDDSTIPVIAKAARFYDIGLMCVPDAVIANKSRAGTDQAVFESHTVIGAGIVQFNMSVACKYFVQVCSDICMHHHEKYDGTGYPHQLRGNDNSVYTQMCSMVIKLDRVFSRTTNYTDKTFDSAMSLIMREGLGSNQQIMNALESCRSSVISYYKKLAMTKRKLSLSS